MYTPVYAPNSLPSTCVLTMQYRFKDHGLQSLIRNFVSELKSSAKFLKNINTTINNDHLREHAVTTCTVR